LALGADSATAGFDIKSGGFDDEAVMDDPPDNLIDFARITTDLTSQGWSFARDFLAPGAIAALAAEAHALSEAGALQPASVGRGPAAEVRAEIRRDQIRWLDEGSPTPAETHFWARIEALRRALNRELFLGLESFEAHYAVYPPGAFYRRHLDRFVTADERSISCSLYLNADWKPEDGGELRLELDQETVEITPQMNTLVIFRSDEIWHEVRPAARVRFSLTGWFRRRALRNIF
jgi:SM-20-related protein